ncbi:DUF4426 domain-containing protein [Catenovulum sp. SM1970]|uniref:DUF4426 domain-containing protein n=1 Tax=Marinifaba aquimaris TaxID=2741323 RepID=UPI001574CF38|nr:DUF4426 domain-containing protein [Marinifaba aquimaris]NTS78086.1 DUF4426 domain-containing protein [Marinifaba aquimaris]
MKRLFFTFLCVISFTSFKTIAADNPHVTLSGDWEIHHISFPSTFIKPDIAQAAGISRSANLALVNISVLDAKSKTPQKMLVTGYARNLLGQKKEMEFIEVDEGDAIYYLGQAHYRNEETLTFTVTVRNSDNRQAQVEFKNKFYVD